MASVDDVAHHINLAIRHVLVPTVVPAEHYHDGLVPYDQPTAGWGASLVTWRTQLRSIRGELTAGYPRLCPQPPAVQVIQTLTAPLSTLHHVLANEIQDKTAQARHALTVALQQRQLLSNGFPTQLAPRALQDMTASHWELVVASALQWLDVPANTTADIAREGFEQPMSATVSRMASLIK